MAEPATAVERTGRHDPLRILIVGAGAIGGLLGVPLSNRGHTVTFLARGAHYRAMKEAGHLTLTRPDDTDEVSAPSSILVDSLSSIAPGQQDVIVLAIKMHQVASVAAALPALLAPNGVYLTTQNGVPWWYFQRNVLAPEHLRDATVESVDPGGVLRDALDPARLLAAVTYPAAEIAAPGTIRHMHGTRFPLGELDGSITPRAQRLSNILQDAGFKAPVLTDVRAELWLKLWGTVAVNPLSALSHATLAELCDPHGPGRAAVEVVMREVQQVAETTGERLRLPMEHRVNGARMVGEHKTSMLQDAEAGRPMEVQAVMGAVVELARKTGCATPGLDVVYGTVSMLAAVLDKYNAKAPLVSLE